MGFNCSHVDVQDRRPEPQTRARNQVHTNVFYALGFELFLDFSRRFSHRLIPSCPAVDEARASTPQIDKVTDGLRLLEVVDDYCFSAIEQRNRLTAGTCRNGSLPSAHVCSSRAACALCYLRSPFSFAFC